MLARIDSLHVYPLKSCRGMSLERAILTATGIEHDREWMFVNEHGRFVSQRELPRLALIHCEPTSTGIRLSVADGRSMDIVSGNLRARRTVAVWRDTVEALDAGNEAACWATDIVGVPLRLVRFAPDVRRFCNREWTGDVEAVTAFSDGYPLLAIGLASLADLNARLTSRTPLPMNRFRPNIVLSGLDPYAEDRIDELRGDGVRLRVVKPCTRCKITTIDQETGNETGDEPLKTLKSYRWDERLRGVTFGQNVIAMNAVGKSLRVGQELEVAWR